MQKTLLIYLAALFTLLCMVFPGFEYLIDSELCNNQLFLDTISQDFDEVEYVIVNDSKISRSLSRPTVETKEPIEITNTSAKLVGELADTGGENCTVWFEWDERALEECTGLIATGDVCKAGRSIILKNRHASEDNQKPWFYKGTNYTYFGVGSAPGMCRMGQNEKGLAIGNFDISGLINSWQFTSDGASGSEDNDMHIPLGNFSTVAEAAFWLARHAFHAAQYTIISSEPGVGALVAVDTSKHSSITWINNTYAAVANAIYSNGEHDPDGNDIRVQEILDDIVNNGTSSEGDNKLNWRDAAQRISKDTHDKEEGTGKFSYFDEISRGSSRSAMVAVAGNDSLEGALFMSWLNFAPTTQVGIFLPIYAGSLKSAKDIPTNFSSDNSGLGIQPYAEVKHNYASEGCTIDQYQCARVREILEYANYNENLTFGRFSSVLKAISSTTPTEARAELDQFVEKYLPIALKGYIENITSYHNLTQKQTSQGIGTFYETLTGLKPGTIYHVRAWASNSKCSANGSELSFLTRPNKPEDLLVIPTGQHGIKLTWSRGLGANNTIIERNNAPNWLLGEGIKIYNGTENIFQDTGLSSGTQYYYQLWSFTSKEGKYQFSDSFVSGGGKTRFGNRAPMIESSPTTQATENELYFTLLQCSDPDGDSVTWGLETDALWLSISGNNLSGTPGDFDKGPYFVNVSCDDNNGSVVYQNFTLFITPIPDAPEFISKVSDIEFQEDGYYQLNLTGIGYDADGDNLSWRFEGVENSLLEIIPLGNQTFIIYGKLDQFGTNKLLLILEDDSPEKLNSTQVLWINITPVNDSPLPPIITYEINDTDPNTPGKQNLTVQFTAYPNDVDISSNNTYAWDFDDDGIIDVEGPDLDRVNHTYPLPRNYTVNLTFTDTGGLSNRNSINITVTAPTETENGEDHEDGGSSEDSILLLQIIGIVAVIIIIVIILLIFLIFRKNKNGPSDKIKQQN